MHIVVLDRSNLAKTMFAFEIRKLKATVDMMRQETEDGREDGRRK